MFSSVDPESAREVDIRSISKSAPFFDNDTGHLFKKILPLVHSQSRLLYSGFADVSSARSSHRAARRRLACSSVGRIDVKVEKL